MLAVLRFAFSKDIKHLVRRPAPPPDNNLFIYRRFSRSAANHVSHTTLFSARTSACTGMLFRFLMTLTTARRSSPPMSIHHLQSHNSRIQKRRGQSPKEERVRLNRGASAGLGV